MGVLMGRFGIVFASIILLSLLLSCTVPAPSSGVFLSPDIETTDIENPELTSGTNEASDFEGLFFMRSETSNCVNASGAVLETINRNWYLLKLRRMEQTEGSQGLIEARIRQCAIELSPVILGIAPFVPHSLLDAQGEQVFYFFEGPHGALQSSPMIELWGMNMDDPINEPMPEDENDHRIFDEDQDGNPGVTMILGDNFCEMFLVQRTVNIYRGWMHGVSLARGNLVSDVSQKVIGGTKPLCLTKNQTLPNRPKNQFSIIRADGLGEYPLFDANGDGQVDCMDIRDAAMAIQVRQAMEYQDLERDHSHCENGVFGGQ